MNTCSCGSKKDFEGCCGPIISTGIASSPETLMRSRYTAFVLGKIDHLERTNAPEIRPDFNRAEAERTYAEVEWFGLTVHRASENENTGKVEFSIRFRRNGRELTQYEISSFRREGGYWFYVGGQVSAKPPPKQVTKIGRNDPCPCGSGKKYKKCCST